jgi:hypothetical protein
MSSKMRFPILLAALAVLLNGCVTTKVWEQKAFHVPAPESQLKLSVGAPSGDMLVEYDEVNERSDQVRHRAYFLEANKHRLERGRKPRFVDPKRYPDLLPLDVFSESNSESPIELHPSDLYATRKGNVFILHVAGSDPTTHSLPVYFDGVTRTTQVFLTPPAVLVDASIVGGVIGYIILNSMAESRTLNTW